MLIKVEFKNTEKPLFFKSKSKFNKFALNWIYCKEKELSHFSKKRKVEKENLLSLLNSHGVSELKMMIESKLIDVDYYSLFNKDEDLEKEEFFKFNDENKWLNLKEKVNGNVFFNKLENILVKDYNTKITVYG